MGNDAKKGKKKSHGLLMFVVALMVVVAASGVAFWHFAPQQFARQLHDLRALIGL